MRLAPRIGVAWALDDARAVVRGGYGIFLNQWAYSVQTAFARNLPFFFTKQVDVPADVRVPSLATRDILTSNATGTVGGSIMDYAYSVEYSQTWSAGLQYALWPTTMAEISYMGTWTLGADNATVRNVPEPGPGSIQARRPIPQLSRINAIRFDGKSIYHGLTVKIDRRLDQRRRLQRQLHAVDVEGRRLEPRRHRVGGQRPAGRAQHLRRDRRVGAVELRPPPPVHRQRLGGPAVAGRRRRVRARRCSAAGAPTPSSSCRAARRSRSTSASIAPTSAPVRRSGPTQLGDPNLPGGERTPDRWFDTGAFALPAAFTFGSARRNSVIGPGYANVDAALAKTWRCAAAATLELRWEVFNLLNRANFDLPNRIFGNPNFGRIFSAKNPREMQFGVRLAF